MQSMSSGMFLCFVFLHKRQVLLLGVYSHSGDVLPREGVGGVADQKTCFTHRTNMEKKRRRLG